MLEFLLLAYECLYLYFFAALGENIAERSGVLNLGVEGMMLLGAFSGFMGTYLTGNIVVGLLMAMGGAAASAALMAFLSVTIRTNQLAAGLAVWLLGVGLASFYTDCHLAL